MVCPQCHQSHGVLSDSTPGLCVECIAKYHRINHEKARLISCVDDFAKAMKVKLMKQAELGWVGWDDDRCCGNIESALMVHVGRLMQGQPQAVDVANLAMFLWNMRGRS